MAMHAVQNVGDAVKATRRFLTPVDARRWAKLALVAFFVGGGMSAPSAGFDASGSSTGAPPADVPFELSGDLIRLVAVIAVALALLGVVFLLVGAIMEFVFVEALRKDAVTIQRYWRRRWRQGLRLFVFRLAIALPALGLFVGWMALLVGPFVLDSGPPRFSVGLFLAGLPLFFVVGILYALVSGFTTAFVVPIMITEECGVLAGWRRLWGSIKADWREYLVYAVLGFVLAIFLGFLASLVVGIAAVIVLLPLAAVAAITYITVSFSSTLGIAVLAVLALLFVLLLSVCWAIVQVPVVVYLRYYALLVLGDLEPAFDVVSEQRRAVRE